MKQFRNRLVINKFNYYIIFNLSKYIPRKLFDVLFNLTIYKVVVVNLTYDKKYDYLKNIIENIILNGTIVLVSDVHFINDKTRGLIKHDDNISNLLSEAKKICSDYWLWRTMAHKYYRQIMSDNDIYKRKISVKNTTNLVSIILPTCRPQNIDLIITNISRQNYFNLELFLITQNYSSEHVAALKIKLNHLTNLIHFEIIEDNSSCNLGARLNKAIKLSNGSFIAKMDDDDIYFDNYISDAMIPMLSLDCDIVGKKEIFIYLEGQDKTYLKFCEEFNCVTDFVAGATFLIRKTVFENIKFDTKKIKGVDTLLLTQANIQRYKVYSADPFNFIIHRSKNINNHTWQITEKDFLNSAKLITNGKAQFINV